MNRRVMAAIAASTVLAGCAGRDPVPVSAYKPSDTRLTCADLAAEIRSNNANMLVRAKESADTSDRNVVIGVTGILLFAPALLAIDAKDAAATENRAYEERNRLLAAQARNVGCPVPAPLTVAMAEAQVEQAKAEKEEAAGVPQTAAAQPSVTSPIYAPAPGGPELKDLMGRFLRGEITQQEYERQRMQLASN